MSQFFVAEVGGQTVGYFDFGHGLWTQLIYLFKGFAYSADQAQGLYRLF